MTNIILCGGSRTRLWSLSRTLMLKQSLVQKEISYTKVIEKSIALGKIKTFMVCGITTTFAGTGEVAKYGQQYFPASLRRK